MAELDRDSVARLEKAIAQLTQTIIESSDLVGGQQIARGPNIFDPERDAFIKAKVRERKTISEYTKHIKDLIDIQKEYKDNVDSGIKNQQKANDVLKAITKNFADASGVMNSLKHQMNIVRQLSLESARGYEQSAYVARTLAKHMRDGTSEIVKNTRASTMLHATQIEQINNLKHGEQILQFRHDVENELNNAIKNGAKDFAREFGILNEVTGELRDNLSLQELSDFRLALGEFDTSIVTVAESVEALKKSGDLTLDALVNLAKREEEVASDARYALAALTNDLIAKGMIGGDILQKITTDHADAAEKLFNVTIDENKQKIYSVKSLTELNTHFGKNSEVAKAFYNELLSTNKVLTKTRNAIDSSAVYHNTAIGQLIKGYGNLNATVFKWRRQLMDLSTITANLGIAFIKAKQGYKELVDFNISQVTMGFWDTFVTSFWHMGMSFDDTVKFMRENTRLLATVGPDEFQRGLGQLQGTFRDFGFNMQQASDLIGPAVDAAMFAGVNLSNMDNLNTYINESMNSFQRMSAITGITAKEFFELNRNLFQSSNIVGTLVGLDQERRQEYARGLVAVREHYAALTGSAELAQELIKMERDQARAPVLERIRGAAMTMVRGQMAGLGTDQAMEGFRLALSPRLTEEQQLRFGELQRQIGTGMEQRFIKEYERGGIASALIFDRFREVTGSNVDQLQHQQLHVQASINAQRDLTKAQVDQIAKLARGNESLAGFSQAVNMVTSLINSAFVGTIAYSTLALVGLAKAAMVASAALKGTAGTGVAGGLFDRIFGGGGGSRGGKLGRIASGVARATPLVGTVAATGLALHQLSSVSGAARAGQITQQQANMQEGGILGGLSATLGGGLLGQKLIPIPGVGFIIGAAAGTLSESLSGGWLGSRIGDALNWVRGTGSPINQTELATRAAITTATTAPTGTGITIPATLNVNDENANAKLASLITIMTQATEFLGAISNVALRSDAAFASSVLNTTIAKSPRLVPTTTSYLTGRAQ